MSDRGFPERGAPAGGARRPAEPALSSVAGRVRQSVFAELQARIDAFRAGGGELIALQIGDAHLAPQPDVMRALAAAPEGELERYGEINGLARLRAALAQRAHGLGLTWVDGDRHVLLGCGATHGLFCTARVLFDPGDEVLVASPYWPLIPGVLHAAGAVPVEVPLAWRLYFEPDLDVRAVLEAARGPRTRGLYLISPNNPDGQVYDRRVLGAAAAFAAEHGLWLISDEVYADFVYEGEHVALASLPGMAERTVSAYSLSKSHALAGARIGYIVAPERVVTAARRIANHTIYNVPVTMQRAALAALAAGDESIAAARARYAAARAEALAALHALGLSFAPPRGGSFVFVDFTRELAGRPLRVLLERAIDHGVLLAPGEAFGTGYERHARLCFTGVPAPVLAEGIRRLGRALAAL